MELIITCFLMADTPDVTIETIDNFTFRILKRIEFHLQFVYT